MKLRMPGKEYTDPGYYFCTLVVEGRRPLFGRVASVSVVQNATAATRGGAASAQSQCSGEHVLRAPFHAPYGHSRPHRGACIAYTPYGRKVARELEQIGKEGQYKGTIEVKGKAILPDHIHVLLHIKKGIPKALGWVLNGFNTGCRRHWKLLCGIKLLKTAPVPVFEDCREEMRTGHWRLPEGQEAWPLERADGALHIFEYGYNDQVVYREGQLDAYYRYMEANAWRLLMKKLYPDLFRKVWKKELLPGQAFDLIGNMFLLDRPWRVPVRISRYAVEEEAYDPYDPEGSFILVGGKRQLRRTKYLYPRREKTPEEIQAAMVPYLQIARAGAVLVTPCISPAEQAVVQAAYRENLPVVMMCFNGFSKGYHPSEAHYDACSRGILLQLAPWRYDPGRIMSKLLCEKLNELAFRFADLC